MPVLLRVLLILLFFTAISTRADAQAFQRRKASADEPAPRALLVMLPTARRRLDALKEIGDTKRAESLRYDVSEIQRKMVADFRENFSFCPVYFFYDTASSFVRRGEFGGHLYDTDLHVPESGYYTSLNKDYLIAFFGYRTRDVGDKQVRDGMEYAEMVDGDNEAMLQNLVLLDANMQQLMRPLPRTVANRYPGIKTKDKRPRYMYRHYAKYFDLQYKPSASRASAVLENFYGSQATPAAAAAVVPVSSDSSPK